jgi:hypothetical protein
MEPMRMRLVQIVERAPEVIHKVDIVKGPRARRHCPCKRVNCRNELSQANMLEHRCREDKVDRSWFEPFEIPETCSQIPCMAQMQELRHRVSRGISFDGEALFVEI